MNQNTVLIDGLHDKFPSVHPDNDSVIGMYSIAHFSSNAVTVYTRSPQRTPELSTRFLIGFSKVFSAARSFDGRLKAPDSRLSLHHLIRREARRHASHETCLSIGRLQKVIAANCNSVAKRCTQNKTGELLGGFPGPANNSPDGSETLGLGNPSCDFLNE